ncbi:MAG TPA: hypothetical protein VE964_18350 [Myxococcales bacterium]|nr:hypothetical protein [Myxococcales bacterium]
MADREQAQPEPWKPSLNPGVALLDLPLTAEESRVAMRIDGATDLQRLSAVTGLPPERVEAALEKLVSLGAVSPRPGTPAEAPAQTEPETEDGEEDEAAAAEQLASGTHRQLFETTLRQLAPDERVVKAKAAEEPELSALCFDPLPAVVHALLENPRFSLPQARLVAAHHPTPAGLEALAGRAALAADAGVRRALLRNPQLSTALMRRLYAGRRLLEQHKLVISRDVPEQTRRTARELLRARFSTAEAEERVEVIVKTEGRCLSSLAGLPVDGKTAALLCGRTYTSTLLVQNISRWAACPPSLIAHLLKQELVRRSPGLRLLLQRHPNAPSEPRR